MTQASNLSDQADRIASLILGEDKSLDAEWLRWIFNEPGRDRDRLRLFRDDYLPFLHDTHKGEFADVLDVCRDGDGNFSIHILLRHMDPERSRAVIKRLGLSYNPDFITKAEILNRGLGKKIDEYLQSRYGIDRPENAADMADLLHAAFFQELAGVVDSHRVVRVLSEYLSSSRPEGERPIFDPRPPSLDTLVAFFNSYDDKEIIENILIDLERRTIFGRLSMATKEYLADADQYAVKVDACLDDILGDLRSQRETASLEGSRRILDRLIERYSALQKFKLAGIRRNINGWAFPRFYQAEAILDISRNKRFLIADEMGTGKTATAILASEYIAK